MTHRKLTPDEMQRLNSAALAGTEFVARMYTDAEIASIRATDGRGE